MSRIELIDRVSLYPGDCMEVLASLEPDSIDSCVTDPPYHLTSIVKRFGAENAAPAKGGVYNRSARGFMGKQWDGGEIAFEPETWAAVMRVLKPGGHLLAFGAPKNFGFMQYAIAQAGFEVRDVLCWMFGSGFPKSHDVSKAMDKAARGVPHGGADPTSPNHGKYKGGCSDDNPGGQGFGAGPGQFMREQGVKVERELDDRAAEWQGWGTALKPAYEPIIMARKPLIGTVAANVLQHGTGAINIDGCRAATDENLNGGAYTGSERHDGTENWRFKNGEAEFKQPPGRWPANVLHDGSDEVVGAFPDAPGQQRASRDDQRTQGGVYGVITNNGGRDYEPRDDGGSAARFFYTAKADADDRLGSRHPTVKPLDLMQWLVRLVTPKGGLVLDPFAGTGTTGEAAWREGMRAILIEREAEYQDDIKRRMRLCLAGPDERARESIKAKIKGQPIDDGPLFNMDAAE